MAFGADLKGSTERIPAAALAVALLALLLVGGLWLLTFAAIRIDLEEARESEMKQNENLVLAQEEQVIRLLKEVDQLLLLLKSQYEGKGTRIDLSGLFADGVLDDATFTFAGVIDEQGDLIATGKGPTGLRLADRAFFKDHQQSNSNALRIGEPVLGRSSGRWAIPLTRRIAKPDGSFGGVVNIAVDASHFTAMFQKSDLGPTDVMALVRSDGIILARRLGPATSFGENISKSPLLAAVEQKPAGSYSTIGMLDPTQKFVSYRKLQDYPLIVTVATTEADALAPVRGREQRYLVAAGLGTFFLAAFCALIVFMLLRQKQANARIREQLGLIDQARDGIVLRGMDDRIEFWNKGAERIYGWTAAEAIGQRVGLLLHADMEQSQRAREVVLSAGEWSGEATHQHRDGHTVTIDDHWTLLRDARGQPKSILAIKTDISERVLVEAQLRQSQRLEAVGQLTGGVAHDFNNLLTVILGNSDILAERLRDNPKLRQLAEMNLQAASRGAELTSRLLAFARRQALDPKAVNPNKLLVGMHDLLSRTLTENIEMELVQGAGLWHAMIDPGQLESAILNLCLNARDAMPGGGLLTIETANARIDQDYANQQGDIDPGQYVLIIVTDTGTGMAPTDLSRAFDPFFTTKEFGKGTGLGLSMVYGFVKQSRGHIKIYSELGQGTSVKIYLPRAGSLEDKPVAAPAATANFHGTEKILLVEDDEFVRSYAGDQLAELGYRVIAVRNGAEALVVLQQRTDIDLLFTDVVMPGGISGRELADQARKLHRGLKVLYTSGYTENSIVHQGRLDAGVHLLNKPYRRIDLAQKVRIVLSDAAP